MIQVKKVGWLKGHSGTGNVFEIIDEGQKTLAMIWEDGKFHQLSHEQLLSQQLQGTAGITSPLSGGYVSMRLDDIETSNFSRLYSDSGSNSDSVNTNEIEIPYSFSGVLRIDLTKLGIEDIINRII